MRDLHLTTPHIHGTDVAHLQQIMHTKGWFNAKIDGDYGPLTAQAVYRSKFWLGYRKPDHAASELFESYVSGRKKTTVLMRLLRNRRLKKKPKPGEATLADKALANAKASIGQKEHPAGTNKSAISNWYGVVGPWCAMSVTKWYLDAGSKVFKRGKYVAYVPYIVADARAGRNNLTITHNPKPGDIVCYDWPGESPGVADHTGLFEKWINKAQGQFNAVEGNTAVGNDSNGGEVMRRERFTSNVICFVHVGK